MEIVGEGKTRRCYCTIWEARPLKLAVPLAKRGVGILRTPPDSIDMAGDRKRFAGLFIQTQPLQPDNGNARSFTEAKEVAASIGYPVLNKAFLCSSGRAMRVVFDDGELEEYMALAVDVSPEHPVLIDQFLRAQLR